MVFRSYLAVATASIRFDWLMKTSLYFPIQLFTNLVQFSWKRSVYIDKACAAPTVTQVNLRNIQRTTPTVSMDRP